MQQQQKIVKNKHELWQYIVDVVAVVHRAGRIFNISSAYFLFVSGLAINDHLKRGAPRPVVGWVQLYQAAATTPTTTIIGRRMQWYATKSAL